MEEAQSQAAAIAAGRLLDHEESMAKKIAKHEKKKHTIFVDANGNKVMLTEEDNN